MMRRLRHLYWRGIVITMAMMVKLKIDDTRESLRSILHAASAWTMESMEDLQSMAESIASVSPPLRVTFLMEQGQVLTDSEADALSMENHATRPEVQEALQGGIGEILCFSNTQAVATLYAAMRISPVLIPCLNYPLWELAGVLAAYGAGLLCLFLILYVLQRRTLSRFGRDLLLQMVMMGSFAATQPADSLTTRVMSAALPALCDVTDADFSHFCEEFSVDEDTVCRLYYAAVFNCLWADIRLSPDVDGAAGAARRVLLLFLSRRARKMPMNR